MRFVMLHIQRVSEWERFHRADVAAAEQTRHLEQEELLNHLEHTLLVMPLDEHAPALASSASNKSSTSQSSLCSEKPGRRRSAPDGSALRRSGSGTAFADEETMNARIVELEKLCKQKVWSRASLYDKEKLQCKPRL